MVRATSRLLRERGAEGVSVQEAMSAAGLTHGGFYKHFASKDELVASAAGAAFADIEARLDRIAAETPEGASARTRVIDDYLTVDHRDRIAEGCANTALAADAARAGDPALRDAYLAGLRRTVEQLASLEDGAHTHERALQDLVVLVGGLTLARATAGDPVSEELLAAARDLLNR
ncbi:TetR/AcrR family transcriptional regulator [Microbacterium caowuchunii]|uniref:TetR/AcrR family transcriptional regulator n=1 Tax=Microbacterium caowuchunii TaxID=2614638 RepID=UPI001CD5A4ED|nr:TetR/AcrR family transcriptional regulator [Microbacterium caowuchunii]